jgi:hypothetical protein
MNAAQKYFKERYPHIREVDLKRLSSPDMYDGRGGIWFYYNPYAVEVWTKWCRDNGIKLGRWADCKYCYSTVTPLIGDGVVYCSECGYGIADLTILETISGVCHKPILPKTLKINMPDTSYLKKTESINITKLAVSN